jgi:hypothetical protein
MKKIELKDCVVTVDCTPETIPIEGNASAIDDRTDREIVNNIRKQLEIGNAWAWCIVCVTVEYRDIEENEYLGGCSYNSRYDFIHNSGYYEDMVNECLTRINDTIAAFTP